MNGSINGSSTAARINSMESMLPTGSKKRKRGLAPKRNKPVEHLLDDKEREKVHVTVTAAKGTKTGKATAQKSAIALLPTIASTEQVNCTDKNDEMVAEGVATKFIKCRACSMCSKSEPHALVNLSANEVMRHTLLNYWKMPARSINDTLSSLCVQCVYKINAHKEITRSLTIRLHRISSTSRTIINHATENVGSGETANNNAAADEQKKLERNEKNESKEVTKTSPNKKKKKASPKRKKKEEKGKKIKVNKEKSANTNEQDLKKLSADTEILIPMIGAIEENVPSQNSSSCINININSNSNSISNSNNDNDKNNSCCLNSSAVLTPESVRASDDAVDQQLHIPTPPLLLPPATAEADADCKLSLLDVRNIASPPYSPIQTRRDSTEARVTNCEYFRSMLKSPVSHTDAHTHTPTPTSPMAIPTTEDFNFIPLIQGSEELPCKAYVVHVEDVTPVKEARAEVPLHHNILAPSKPNSTRSHAESRSPSCSGSPSHSQSNSPSSGTALHHHHHQSMLQVVRERSEFAHATESGGKINNYKRVQNMPQQLACPYCRRVYWRKYYLSKHLRHCATTHWHKSRSVKSVNISKSPAQTHTFDAKSVVDELDEQYSLLAAKPSYEHDVGGRQKAKRLFHCPECAVTVESQNKLREHKRIHLQRHYCGICGTEFNASFECGFHQVVCEAQQEALKNNMRADSPTVGSVRITRSRSRAASIAASVAASKTTTTYHTTSAYSYSHFSSTHEFDEYEPNVDNNDNEEYDDYYEDAVSVVDTMYTKRMRFTGNWVEDHSNSNSYLSLCDNNISDYDDENHISSYKEYDLYLLDRFKAQVHLCSLTCFATNCDFSTSNLLDMMLHDYEFHFKYAWFYCHKCGRSFTSKVFLDYHLDRQNGGRYICYKCGDIFEFQYQLDRHLIRHTKCINYRCNYCKFEFLTENELLQHCDTEQHDPNGERKLIHIDPHMTIVNKVPPLEAERLVRRHHTYTTAVLNMGLPHKTRRAADYHPYRRKIGDVLFSNQKHPNCSGWK